MNSDTNRAPRPPRSWDNPCVRAALEPSTEGDFLSMSTKIMPESEALSLFFCGAAKNADGVTVESGFRHALNEARVATGRDPDKGSKTNPQLHGSWIGAIGYFTLLDQISDCFRPKGVASSQYKDLRTALEHFTPLDAPKRDALYALRNAFTHDYSLYNIGKPPLTHHFSVTRGAAIGAVVILPKTAWDGDYMNRVPDNQTTVNLAVFGDLVEDVVATILSLHTAGNLEIALKDGSDELVCRYLFRY